MRGIKQESINEISSLIILFFPGFILGIFSEMNISATSCKLDSEEMGFVEIVINYIE